MNSWYNCAVCLEHVVMSVFLGITKYYEAILCCFTEMNFSVKMELWIFRLKGKGFKATIGLSMKSACGSGINVGPGQQFGYSF